MRDSSLRYEYYSLIVIAVLISVSLVSASAQALEHSYYRLESQGSGQYTEGNFTGNYYPNNQTNSNLIVHAECKGGSYLNNYTTLQLKVWNGFVGTTGINENIQLNSTDASSSLLSANVNHLSYYLVTYVHAFTEFHSHPELFTESYQGCLN